MIVTRLSWRPIGTVKRKVDFSCGLVGITARKHKPIG